MTLTRETLVEAIQTSMHIWDEAAPVFARLEIPGLRGQIGPTPYAPLNLLGMARLDEATADAVIHAVIERFAAEGKGFAWAVGPGTTPADLASRLQAAGLHKEVEFAGMALTDLSQPVPANPAIRIASGSASPSCAHSTRTSGCRPTPRPRRCPPRPSGRRCPARPRSPAWP